MRILLAGRPIQSTEPEGGLQVQRDLALALVERNLQPSVLGSVGGWAEGVDVIHAYRGSRWSLARRYEFLASLWRSQSAFDVVHCIHVPTRVNALTLRAVSRRGRADNVAFVQTLSALPPDQRTFSDSLWGDVIVAQSTTAQEAIRRSGRDSVLIPPWPSSRRVAFDAARRESTRRVMFSEWERVVVFPGEFQRLGVDVGLLEAIGVVLDEDPGCGVVLACRFDNKGIGSAIEETFPGRVVSLGAVRSGLIPILEAADLVIYPALRMDGKFQPPLVLLESLTLGTPISVSLNVEIPQEARDRTYVSDPSLGWREYGSAVSTLLDRLPARDPHSLFENTVNSYLSVFEALAQ